MTKNHHTQKSRVTEREMQDILYKASKAYVAYDSSISLHELINAGKGAEIPARFVIDAYNSVLLGRHYKNRFWQIFKAATLVVGSVLFTKIPRNNVEPQIVNDAPAPVALPDSHHIHSIKDKQEDDYDGNPVFDILIYQVGNSGHVTEIKCILPPDINSSSIKMISKGDTNMYGWYFCNPLNS